jgi:hypothetical protein
MWYIYSSSSSSSSTSIVSSCSSRVDGRVLTVVLVQGVHVKMPEWEGHEGETDEEGTRKWLTGELNIVNAHKVSVECRVQVQSVN